MSYNYEHSGAVTTVTQPTTTKINAIITVKKQQQKWQIINL